MPGPVEPHKRSRHQGVGFAANPAGQVVSPDTAPRGERYTCLGCQGLVTLRRGLVRVPHFAHRSESSCAATGESIEHAAFKQLLATGLREHRRFTAQLRCPSCTHDQTATYPLPEGSEVHLEFTVGAFRADVAVVRDGQVMLAFEVFVTHEIGVRKALDLPVPWLEVAANAAGILDLRQRPVVRVLDTNFFRHRPCKACGSTAGSQAEANHLRLLARETQWREEEAQRQAEQAALRQAVPSRHRPEPELPPCWITTREPGYRMYRAPLFVTVLGVPLLVHPSLVPDRLLCETPGTRYVLQQSALRLHYADGREEYASGRLGTLLSDLLMERLTVAPEAGPLLEDVRRLVTAEQCAKSPPPVPAEALLPRQPNLWDEL